MTRGTRTDSPTISENENKSSSNRIYPGVISTTLHMFTISLMLFVFLVDLNSLQNDSDKRVSSICLIYLILCLFADRIYSGIRVAFCERVVYKLHGVMRTRDCHTIKCNVSVESVSCISI